MSRLTRNAPRGGLLALLVISVLALGLQNASAVTYTFNVAAAPSTGLQDNQQVLVSGTGWKANNLVRVFECEPGEWDQLSQFLHCDYNPDSRDESRRQFVPTGAGGDFQTYFPVHKTIYIRDNAGPAPFTTHPYTCDPGCSIRADQGFDESQPGNNAQISFAPENPLLVSLNNLAIVMCRFLPSATCDALRTIIASIAGRIQPPPPPPPTTTTTRPPVTTTQLPTTVPLPTTIVSPTSTTPPTLPASTIPPSTTTTTMVPPRKVSCGEMVAISTTLSEDVGPCKEGIQLSSDGITFDLGGHTIRGTADATGAGLTVGGRSRTTIRNGAITGFSSGITFFGGFNNTVTGLNVSNTVSSGAINSGGISIEESTNTVITLNTLSNNMGPGVEIFGSPGSGSGNRVDNNTIEDNFSAGVGIYQNGGGNVVTNNRIRRNGGDGVTVFSSPNNKVTGNTIAGNGMRSSQDGIHLSRASESEVKSNTVTGNAVNGIYLEGPTVDGATTLPGATGNSVTGNTATANNAIAGGGGGFDLRDGNVSPPCDSNTWTNNTFGTSNQSCIS